MSQPVHVHFMGIGGSGIAGVAILAKKAGFEVSGCDLAKESSYYTPALAEAGIEPLVGHDVSHLEGVDILAVSPAVLAIDADHPEILGAETRGVLMTWQEFMGRYLQKDKFVIAIAGTHGKSTTTALAGLALEAAGLDPIVEVGGVVLQWQASVRWGNSKYFVCEADEFNYNFLHYSPSVMTINNIEMDHPEFFKDFEQFRGSFKKFIRKIKKPKILIVNEESEGIRQVLREMEPWLEQNRVKIIGYFFKKKFAFPFAEEYQGKIIKITPELIHFTVKTPSGIEKFELKLPGRHNVANALGVLACAFELGIKPEKIKKILETFGGISRRFEQIGKEKGITVFDDYGHHPTAVRATLEATKQRYPKRRIWAVFEPHQHSRLYLFLNEFAASLRLADQVIITKIFAGREEDTGKIKAEDLVEKIGSKARYIKDFDQVAQEVAKEARKDDLAIVFGAGKSYLLSRMIVKALKEDR